MKTIVGIDEVGRGCWAGPLVAGAVILHTPIPGLNDSKKLTKIMRTKLAEQIRTSADVGLGWVTPAEVDSVGLTQAVRLAMQRALSELNDILARSVLATRSDLAIEAGMDIVIDGNYNFLPDVPGSRAVVRADGSVPEVSAASIVAKVARDTYMEQLGEQYAKWQFSKHVGYGTQQHRELLQEFGISDIHRRSYKPIAQLL